MLKSESYKFWFKFYALGVSYNDLNFGMLFGLLSIISVLYSASVYSSNEIVSSAWLYFLLKSTKEEEKS